MVVAAARAICKLNSDSCGVNDDDNWKQYGETFLEDARAALDAAGAFKLRDALKGLEWACYGVAYIEDEYSEQVTKARAAIAKAEGTDK
jgi:hypothetical protein